MAADAQTARWGLLVIAAGGVVGATLRFGFNEVLQVRAGAFPWATFAVNVLGSLALGALVIVAASRWPDSHYPRLFLGVGLLGSFTTFSTFADETRSLLLAGESGVAATYVGASLALGLGAAWLGVVLARRALGLPPGRIPEQPEEVR